MKSAIILFTTISFVMTITLLIMQIINNNEKLITVDSKTTIDTQALLIINDLKNEIGKQLINKKDQIYELVDKDNYIEYKNIQVKFYIKEFLNPFNLNDFLKDKDLSNVKKYFEENELDFEEFKFFIDDYFSSYDSKKIKLESNSQVEKILFRFSNQEKISSTKNLVNKFTYFNIGKNDQYFVCNVFIKIDQTIYRSDFIYNLKELNEKSIKVRDFEITIS